MKVQPIKSNYYLNTFQKKEQNIGENYNPQRSGTMMTLTGLGVLGALVVTAGILSRNTFEKNILKKGLELKNNVLVNKATGEKYTGAIKSNIGKIGFNKKETRTFVDGVITEKTYKNAFNKELEGFFYKDGKECVHVKLSYPFMVPWYKRTDTYWFAEGKDAFTHFEGIRKDSAFESARKRIQDLGWYKPSGQFHL